MVLALRKLHSSGRHGPFIPVDTSFQCPDDTENPINRTNFRFSEVSCRKRDGFRCQQVSGGANGIVNWRDPGGLSGGGDRSAKSWMMRQSQPCGAHGQRPCCGHTGPRTGCKEKAGEREAET